MPIRYVNQGYPRDGLAGFYRAADVALITPLRDGMNLVAKEYVAAQDPADPGVLILSRFAGAAAPMREALLVNPFSSEDVSEAISKAYDAQGGAGAALGNSHGRRAKGQRGNLARLFCRRIACGSNRENRKLIGRSLVMERGITHDKIFEDWAALVYGGAGTQMSLKNFRKNLRIDLLKEQGTSF